MRQAKERGLVGIACALFALAASAAFANAVRIGAEARTESLTILPAEIELGRRGAEHRLLVERRSGRDWNGDATAGASFRSSDESVATVDEKGIVRATGNGQAEIIALIDGQTLQARVTVTGADRPFRPSFRNDVQPVLYKAGCSTGACHGAAAGKNGFKLSLRGFDFDWDHKAITRQAGGRRIQTANPKESLFLLKPTAQIRHGGSERFEKDSLPYRILRDWVAGGAAPAGPDDPIAQRLEVIPPSVTLRTGQKQQLVVRAHYSDGTYRDVTRWVKFGTTEEAVALVNDEGLVSIEGSGAAAITVWFASKVSFASITAPRSKPVPAEVFASTERNNFIDDLILDQLERLQIAPAALATDTEFVRRAYLDGIGALPTPDEVFFFVMDSDPNKRSKLINRLLGRPEYVDYWSYKWSDLLLVSSKNLPRSDELNAFSQFIRESVAANKPWDQFVREIVTATGSSVRNGATGYWIMHKETVDRAETTSQAFLGTSITCARCHNHPLEKWTQDEYYGFANLFSRVKLKNGPRGGGTLVSASPFGDILHPRYGRPMEPKPLDGEPISLSEGGDRREHLAKWLTSPDNPYFTRAIVNRVWKNFMGTGLVEPEDDLRLTNPASNEKLLSALADNLARHDYDLKHLIREIMNSAAYQRSSRPSDPDAPDLRYYSSYVIRRLSAEALLDAYSRVTGVGTEFEDYPEDYGAFKLSDSRVESYFLKTFGRPERRQTCSCERTSDATLSQALHVANGETLNEKLRDERSFLTALVEAGDSDTKILNTIYMRALGRYPTENESEMALALVSIPALDEEDRPGERREALEDLTWAVLSSKEFLFNH